jgi:hypothetical protein
MKASERRKAHLCIPILKIVCSTSAFSVQPYKEAPRNSFCGMKRKARGAQSPRGLTVRKGLSTAATQRFARKTEFISAS